MDFREQALQAEKNNIPICAFAAILTAFLTVATAAVAQNYSDSGCRWQSGFPEHLGIDTGFQIADGQAVGMLEAAVTDPDRLFSMGLYAARKGDRVKLYCVEPDVWRIKHVDTGLAITFSTRPF